MAGLSFLATDLGIIARIESRAESGVTCRYRVGDVSVRAGEPTSGTISVQRPMRIDDRLATARDPMVFVGEHLGFEALLAYILKMHEGWPEGRQAG